MRRWQKGFTLLEIVVGLGIVGAIVTTVAMTTTTLMANSQKPSTEQTLLQQVQNAGYWISRDVQMAGNVTTTDPNGFPLILAVPIDDDPNHDYTIKYIFNGDTLKRQLYDSSDNLTSETLIAQYVDTDNTTFSNVEADLYKLSIRATLDNEAVTASYEVKQRLASS